MTGATQKGDAPTVTVSAGSIRGVALPDGVFAFKGVPFAAEPVGDLRFAPAQPHPGWLGVRSGDAYGPAALQPRDPMLDIIPEMQSVSMPSYLTTGEDCLYLNVWTKDVAGTKPVIVWIHGGAFLTGSGGGAWYGGEQFTRRHDVVYVSINYRLGLLGMLDAKYTDDPDAVDFSSIALRDQVAALTWVRDNIASFGGDPGRVTVAGESAGAASIALLLAMPATDGLIHRAIMQSGHASWTGTREQSEARTHAVMDALGVTRGPGALAALQAIPAERFLSIADEIGIGVPFPSVDGAHLPQTPLELLAAGASRDVPVIIGTNSDESGSLRRIVHAPEERKTFEQRLREFAAPDEVLRLLTLYPGEDDDERWDALCTDRDWHKPARDLALAHSSGGGTVYVYEFGWLTDALNGLLGSSHQAEIPFALDNLAIAATTGMHRPTIHLDELAITQSLIMSTAWAQFARTGDPGSPAGVDWQPFTASEESTMVFDHGTAEITSDFRATQIDYWRHHPFGAPEELDDNLDLRG